MKITRKGLTMVSSTHFDPSTGVETVEKDLDGGHSINMSAPLMERYDAKPVIVVSYWPGNGSASGTGGFDWFPITDENIEWAKGWLADQLIWFSTPPDHASLSVVILWVPKNLTHDEVTRFVENHSDEREIRAQDFSDLPLSPGPHPPGETNVGMWSKRKDET